MQKKINPSSAAFLWDNLVITDYSSGCLRAILMNSKGIREASIPKAYAEVGEAHEKQHELMLQSSDQVVAYVREYAVKVPVAGYEDIMYSGRIDFLCNYLSVGKVVHETKGTISKNTRLKVLRKGEVKVNQLAQLVSYMIVVKTTKGKLFCAYYELDNGVLQKQEERVFKVEIDDSGAIFIDGTQSQFTVQQQMAHRNMSAKVVQNDLIYDRPDKWNQKFGGPCTSCVFKRTCDAYDDIPMTVEEFCDSAKQDIALKAVIDASKPSPLPNVKRVSKTKKENK